MARIVIEKSPIADFLDELPGLLLQYKQLQYAQEERDLDRQATLLDRQIARNERRYDLVSKEYEDTRKEYEQTTGLVYKLSDKDKGDAIGVLDDIKGGAADSLNSLLLDIKTDTRNLQSAKIDMEKQLGQTKLISSFYKGYGHDMSAGDPERWDAQDFSEEALTEYMSQYPELEGVDQQAFFEGVRTREEAGLFQNIQALNTIIDQTKTAELSAASKELEYNTQVGNIDRSQLEADIDGLATGIHNMISNQATSLNTGILSPAISAVSQHAAAQEAGTGEADAKELQEEELIKVGTLISGIEAQDESMLAENLRLGMLFVSGNVNYVNSIESYLRGSDVLNYGGWIDALQEVEMYSEYHKSQFEAGAITRQQYLAYTNNIEELVGDDFNSFSDKLGVVIAASEQTENKGQLLALKSMQDTIEQTPIVRTSIDTTPIDQEIDDPALKSLDQISKVISHSDVGSYTYGAEGMPIYRPSPVSGVAISDPILNKQQKVIELTDKLDILKKAGFQGTEAYEDISNNVKALTGEIREAQLYKEYMADIEERLVEGQMSDEEISEISIATGISESSLKEYLEKGRTEKVLDILSNIPGTPPIKRRATYERRLQK